LAQVPEVCHDSSPPGFGERPNAADFCCDKWDRRV
jgi:hypothetical protein